jgi:hypothetical protein
MPDLDQDRVLAALESELGGADSVASGEHSFRCPFCAKAGYTEKTSHLHVALAKGMACCHQCGAGFRSLHGLILALYGRIPRGLGKKCDNGDALTDQVENLLYRAASEEGEEPEEISLPRSFVPLTKKPKDRLGKVVLEYLTGERAVPFDYLAEVGAGYCTSGSLRGYAIFPVHVGGRFITYTSRRVTGLGSKVRHAFGGSSASVVLFNFDSAKDCRRLFIGEGPFDAFALHQTIDPDDGGMATLGTRVYDGQIALIADLPCEEVVFWYDADAMDKATEAARRLTDVSDKRVRIVRHTDKDPDELSVKRRRRLAEAAEEYKPGLSDVRALLGACV